MRWLFSLVFAGGLVASIALVLRAEKSTAGGEAKETMANDGDATTTNQPRDMSSPVVSQEIEETVGFSRLKRAYGEKLVTINEKHAALLRQTCSDYTNALASLQQDLAKKGDLDGVVAAMNESHRFMVEQDIDENVGSQVPADLKVVRTRFKAQLVQIETDKKKATAKLTSAYRAVLDRMAESLNAPASKRVLVLWNTQNGWVRDRGTLTCNISLLQGFRTVWEKKAVQLPWGSAEDARLQIELPDGPDFQRIRVEITNWIGRGGGLAEILVMEGDNNIASGCEPKASGYFSDTKQDTRFVPARVTDDVTVPLQGAQMGYWLLPDSTPGWIEIDLRKKRQQTGTTRR